MGETHVWQTELQDQRLAQLQSRSQRELNAFVQHLTTDRRLPRLNMHFRQHGKDLETTTPEEYELAFLYHIARDDLRLFTFLRRRELDAVWYLLAEDTGATAMYNETAGRYWSFFHISNLQRFLEESRGRLIELIKTEQRWDIRIW